MWVRADGPLTQSQVEAQLRCSLVMSTVAVFSLSFMIIQQDNSSSPVSSSDDPLFSAGRARAGRRRRERARRSAPHILTSILDRFDVGPLAFALANGMAAGAFAARGGHRAPHLRVSGPRTPVSLSAPPALHLPRPKRAPPSHSRPPPYELYATTAPMRRPSTLGRLIFPTRLAQNPPAPRQELRGEQQHQPNASTHRCT